MCVETIYLIENLLTVLVFNIKTALQNLGKWTQYTEWLILAYLESIVVCVLDVIIQEWSFIKTTDEDESSVCEIAF